MGMSPNLSSEAAASKSFKSLVRMFKIYGFTSQIVFPKAYPGTAVFCFCSSVVLSSFLNNLLSKHMPGHVLQSVQSKHAFYPLNISLWELQELPCISEACWGVFALLMAKYLVCDLGVIFGINFCIVQQWGKLELGWCLVCSSVCRLFNLGALLPSKNWNFGLKEIFAIFRAWKILPWNSMPETE